MEKKMDSKLNICLMNDSFPPVIDGVANTVFNYADIIQKGLGNAIVATPEYPGVEDNYDFDIVRYKSFDTTGIFGYRAGYPFAPSTVGKLDEKNIDIIHSHCPAVSTVLARMLREKVSAPIIFTYHTKFDIDIRKAIESNLLQDTMIKLLVKNVEACDDVWVVSEGAGENLKSLGYKGDYIVMENGVDFPKGRADEKSVNQINEVLGINDDAPVFLFVGRLMWYKGMKLILDALRVVKEKGEKFHMVIVGDGADGKDIQQYSDEIGLSDYCIFTGAVQDREVLRAYYTRADMFLFVSTYDTNGIVVREAAACGLGSVLIKGSCAAEKIVHERNGYLIDETEESLADAVLRLIHNVGLAREIGNNAMNEIYIPWEKSVNTAYERYEYVLSKFRSPRYEPKFSFTDEALSSIAGICEALHKAEKFREIITTGFMEFSEIKAMERLERGIELGQDMLIMRPKSILIDKKEELKAGFAEKKSGFMEKQNEVKERLWHYLDRYL